MGKKHHGGPALIPAGNRPKAGIPFTPSDETSVPGGVREGGEVGSQQEEDPKRRQGDFTGTADHAIQQPDGKNGANH